MAVGLTGQIFEEDYLQQFKQAVCKEDFAVRKS